jgi:hypothetical protein
MMQVIGLVDQAQEEARKAWTGRRSDMVGLLGWFKGPNYQQHASEGQTTRRHRRQAMARDRRRRRKKKGFLFVRMFQADRTERTHETKNRSFSCGNSAIPLAPSSSRPSLHEPAAQITTQFTPRLGASIYTIENEQQFGKG